MGAILKTNKVVTPIDVLVGMHLLTAEKVLDWRRGHEGKIREAVVTEAGVF